MAALLVALVVVNAFAIFMNSEANGSLGTQCSLYVADTGNMVLQHSADYNFDRLKNFVADNSIPQWINPSWRIPSVSIVDAHGHKTYVQGDIVRNSNDDQYNIVKAGCVLRFAAKLEAIDVTGWAFPITMTWIQIEGANILHILKMHVYFVTAVSLWTIILGLLSFRGQHFLQHYVLFGAFASVWFAASVNTARNALLHPPSGDMIAEIPEDQRSSMLQPCHLGPNTCFFLDAIWFALVLQVVIIVAVMLNGKMIAQLALDASGTKDPFYFQNA
jgi:hypothetical protein